MKKILLLAFATITSAQFANAQIAKGSKLLGGAFGFSTAGTPSSRDTNRNISIAPNFGIAVRDNLLFGVELSYERNVNQNNISNLSFTRQRFGGGLFVRKYHNIGSKVYIFGQASANLNFGESINEVTSGDLKAKSFGAVLRVTPGLAYSVTDKLMLEFGIGDLFSAWYNNSTATERTGSPIAKSNSFGLSSSLFAASSVTVGARFLLSPGTGNPKKSQSESLNEGSQTVFTKGTKILRGSAYFNREKPYNSDEKFNSVSLSSSFGVVIAKNLVLGADLRYTSSRAVNPSTRTARNNDFGAGIFTRRYFSLSNSFYLFGQARLGGNYGYYYNFISQPPTVYKTRTHNINFSLQPGIAFSVTKRLQIEAGLPDLVNISYSRIDPELRSIERHFNASASNNTLSGFYAGMSFLFN